MYAPIVVLETFRLIQIDCSFCLCEALCKIFDEDLLALHGNLEVSDGSVGLSLLMSDVIDEAIDDLSMHGCVVGVGGQGRESRAGQDVSRGLGPSGQISLSFSYRFGTFFFWVHLDLVVADLDGDNTEAGLFSLGSGRRHVDAM